MIICICGPTGVGKTKMSIELAKHFRGIIINCDAMQVYKEMNIGTAKIKEEEKEGLKHYLLDIKNLNESFSVYEYQKEVRKIIEENKDKTIILVGGTGLYMKAALYDYEFREENIKQTYDNFSNQELYEMCLKKDKNMNIHINNRQRLIRFLNKTSVSNNKDKLLYDNVLFIGLTTSREKLYEIINKRVDEMFSEGLEKEAKTLFNKYPSSKALKTAIGYKELLPYFQKECSLEDVKDLIKKNSRHYAKRQYTWYKNQMNINWFSVDYENFNNTIKEVINTIKKTYSK